MAEAVTKALTDLRARQKELQPLAEEYRQVESAIHALEQVDGLGNGPKARGARRRGGASAPPKTRRRG